MTGAGTGYVPIEYCLVPNAHIVICVEIIVFFEVTTNPQEVTLEDEECCRRVREKLVSLSHSDYVVILTAPQRSRESWLEMPVCIYEYAQRVQMAIDFKGVSVVVANLRAPYLFQGNPNFLCQPGAHLRAFRLEKVHR
ncbi:hypothetical protein PV721_39220 [Streptomyces sp. MB09-01]|nr:hypothetical protein [Streptomyces sp. MB09-01]